jgi:hypothetical protein
VICSGCGDARRCIPELITLCTHQRYHYGNDQHNRLSATPHPVLPHYRSPRGDTANHGNTVKVTSDAGVAAAVAVVNVLFGGTSGRAAMRGSTIPGNQVTVTSRSGTAIVRGAAWQTPGHCC